MVRTKPTNVERRMRAHPAWKLERIRVAHAAQHAERTNVLW